MMSDPCFISVDIETTGSVPSVHAMIEIGAVHVADPSIEFSVKLHLPHWAKTEPEAIAAIGLTHEELLARYFFAPDAELPADVMPRFVEWVLSTSAPIGTPVFVGNNAAFDWMFVHWHLEHAGQKNPFGHAPLDMKAYFMGMTGCSWKEARLHKMAKHAGIVFEKLPHRAVLDARIQAEIFAKLYRMNRNAKGVAL